MSEEFVGKIFEMISSAGSARSKYIQAVEKAKEEKFEEAEVFVKEGGQCFLAAHNIHAELLADESSKFEACSENSAVSLILVHAEDQMMCAETFRLISQELIDVYKKIKEKEV